MRYSITRWLTSLAITTMVAGAQGQSVQKYVAGAGFAKSKNRVVSICGSFGQSVVGGIGNDAYSASLGFWTGTDGHNSQSDVGELTPAGMALLANAPNPFRDETKIRFTLDAPKDMTINVFAMNGKSMSIRHFMQCPVGLNEYSFSSDHLPAGSYKYTLSDGAKTLAGTMTIMK